MLANYFIRKVDRYIFKMPRVYFRKRQTKFNLTDLQKAVKDVEENKKTYRQAEEAYNVPISVIYHRIKGRKVDINRMGGGVSKVLPARVEAHIASCVKTRAQMGLPVIKEELKKLVKEYVESNSIVNNFKDKKPGNYWYISFMKRHPELTLKKSEHLQKLRMDARKPFIVYDFYEMLKAVVKENNLEEKTKKKNQTQKKCKNMYTKRKYRTNCKQAEKKKREYTDSDEKTNKNEKQKTKNY